MEKVYSVQFKKVGKKYYFGAGDFLFNNNDYVVVETARGVEVGQIASELQEISEKEIVETLKPILRLANSNDLDAYLKNQSDAKNVFKDCQELIQKHGLDMKLLNADYTLDRQKIIFYYTAEDRIDFRELLKELMQKLKTRIELRQIGYRDGAKIAGGLGICGRELCCAKHLREFDTVSIKMAKNQELSLNPSKITGACSKLLCCIKYEDDLYTELRKNLVKIGEFVETPKSKNAKVVGVEVLKQRVCVIEDDKPTYYEIGEVNKISKVDHVKKPTGVIVETHETINIDDDEIEINIENTITLETEKTETKDKKNNFKKRHNKRPKRVQKSEA